MDSNGIGRRGVLVIGFLAATVGAGAAIAWSRSEADSLRRELASVSRRLGRLETPSNDQPPVKLLRAERIEIVAPNWNAARLPSRGPTRRFTPTLDGGRDCQSLRDGWARFDRRRGGGEQVIASAMKYASRLDVRAHGDDPKSMGIATLRSMGVGSGVPSLSLTTGRSWKREDIEAEAKSPTRGAAMRLGFSPMGGASEMEIADASGRTRLSASVAATGSPADRHLRCGGPKPSFARTGRAEGHSRRPRNPRGLHRLVRRGRTR